MKVIEKSHWQRGSGTILDSEDIIVELLSGESESGALEKIEDDLKAMRCILICFLSANIKTVNELNSIAGYERFLAIDEGDKNGT